MIIVSNLNVYCTHIVLHTSKTNLISIQVSFAQKEVSG